MSTRDLRDLRDKWNKEAKESIDRLGPSIPPGIVTEELMRSKVIEWVLEIDEARNKP